MVVGFDCCRIIEVLDAQKLFNALDTFFGENDAPGLLVLCKVNLLLQAGHDGVNIVVLVGGVLGQPGYDERRSGFIHQDTIDLVHDGVGQILLDIILQGEFHIVPEIIEAKLVVCPVDHIGPVSLFPLQVSHVVLNNTNFQTEEFIDSPHPFGIPASQIVVHRHHVNTGPREGVEINRKGCNEGLSFPGFHLGDLSLVKNYPAHDLNVEMPHTQKPYGCLPYHSESLRKQVVQRFPLLQAFPELPRFSFQGGIIQGLYGRFQAIHTLHNGSDPFKLPFVRSTEYFLSDKFDH